MYNFFFLAVTRAITYHSSFFFHQVTSVHFITQRKKPKLLPEVCRHLSITIIYTNTGGATPPRSRADFRSQQLTPVLQITWTEVYRSQKSSSALWPGGLKNWTLMRLCSCSSFTLPIRPLRGQWGRSRSGCQPSCCSTAERREGGSTLRRKRLTGPRRSPPPASHQTSKGLLMMGNGESDSFVLF